MAASSYDENGNEVDSDDESEVEDRESEDSEDSDEVSTVFEFPNFNQFCVC